MRARASRLLPFAAAAMVACQVQPPMGNAPASDVDAGGMTLGPPVLQVPASTPAGTVAIRGVSPGASDVVAMVASQMNAIGAVDPRGGFCVDAQLDPNLPAGTANVFSVVALAGGQVSPAAVVKVIFDPNAAPPDQPTCYAPPIDPQQCAGNLAACDSRCNACPEDYLWPNEAPASAPTLISNVFGLELCPCRSDWFAVTVPPGSLIGARVDYAAAADFDLDVALFDATILSGPVDPIAPSTGSQGSKASQFATSDGGTYYLKVSPIGPSSAAERGAYSLTLTY